MLRLYSSRSTGSGFTILISQVVLCQGLCSKHGDAKSDPLLKKGSFPAPGYSPVAACSAGPSRTLQGQHPPDLLKFTLPRVHTFSLLPTSGKSRSDQFRPFQMVQTVILVQNPCWVGEDCQAGMTCTFFSPILPSFFVTHSSPINISHSNSISISDFRASNLCQYAFFHLSKGHLMYIGPTLL